MKTKFISRLRQCLAVTGILLAGLGILWALSTRHSAQATPLFATITVNTTADTVAADGRCSLREAIQAAKTNAAVNDCPAVAAGLDTIEFNLGTGTPTINVLSALPQITQPLFLNGNTGGATRVELNGASASSGTGGLTILAGGSTVQALVINRFGQLGLVLQTGNGNTVKGCIMGLDAAGTTSAGKNGGGLRIASANNTTDAANNTSEFSACVLSRMANQPPAITANAQTRQAGSPAANLALATVSDNDQTAGTLQVRINEGTSATNNGVTVSNLSISAAGVVTADVVAACNAQNASFTLTVTDNATATTSATLNVTVSANTPPAVSYNNQAVAAGGALTINPASTPNDNGSIASFVLLSVAPNTLSTAPAVNTTSGAVTITNARPAGTYTVTVRASDNCGATTDAAFTLTINCPTITVGPENLSPHRHQAKASAKS